MNKLETIGKQELIKFLKIYRDYDVPSLMFSEAIDQVWHNLLKSTETYEDFCMKEIGVKLEHNVCGGVDVINWVAVYERLYGPLHPFWFADEEFNIDSVAYKNYLDNNYGADYNFTIESVKRNNKKQPLELSWDCNAYFQLDREPLKLSWDCNAYFKLDDKPVMVSS
ncbi:hypothetical protein [Pseudogracilibacillus sp. SO30301A]|uniref:hypothetical protein n=1 Tax=Pseudogracilibacillus sp. SO30301A TaxID=3098291 RepID=UPI00300E26A6